MYDINIIIYKKKKKLYLKIFLNIKIVIKQLLKKKKKNYACHKRLTCTLLAVIRMYLYEKCNLNSVSSFAFDVILCP